MKKLVLCTIMLLLFVSTTGCKKEEKIITADDISVNTILAKANGQLQVATVEDFNKPYYTLNGLIEFVTNEINVYNQNVGEEKIRIDNIQLKNGKAIVLLTYTGMDQYCAFNQVTAAYFSGGIEDNPLNIPATLVSAKDGSTANSDEVMKDGKYKILVMNEPYEIIVDGAIKYYSDNAILVEKDIVQSSTEGMTVVVFKP